MFALDDHGTMLLLGLVATWLVIGLVVGVVEARRGHWARTWLLTAILGPLAVPLALGAWRGFEASTRRIVRPGVAGAGDVDVLVGVDGSEASLCAVDAAMRLFRGRLGRLSIATVVDFEAAAPHDESVMQPEPWDEEIEAETRLQAAAQRIRDAGAPEPDLMVVSGHPAVALGELARRDGYELLVVGSRGRGAAKHVLGSCASKLAGQTRVPVLIVPASGSPGAESTTPVVLDAASTPSRDPSHR